MAYHSQSICYYEILGHEVIFGLSLSVIYTHPLSMATYSHWFGVSFYYLTSKVSLISCLLENLRVHQIMWLNCDSAHLGYDVNLFEDVILTLNLI